MDRKQTFDVIAAVTQVVTAIGVCVGFYYSAAALRLNEAQARAEQRARIFFQAPDETSAGGNTTLPGIKLEEMNGGRTPATEVQETMYSFWFAPAMPPSQVISYLADQDRVAIFHPSPALGGSAKQLIEPQDFEVPKDVLAEVKSGQLIFLVRGVFRYRDIFKEQHESDYCLLYLPKTSSLPAGYGFCDYGNDLD